MSIEDRNLKPGTVLVARYKKVQHRCEVLAGEDGKVVFRIKGGKEFSSPSAAGSAVMGGVACNGWRFWTPEGAEAKAAKATSTSKAAKTPATKAKGASKAKRGAKPKKSRRVAGGTNGEPETPVEKPVNCGDCGTEFPSSREAADHMRDDHGSLEAAGSGGR